MSGQIGAGVRVRLDAEARRSQILESARLVFAEKGYSQSGLSEIAARSAISKTLIYHYFPGGRTELYSEVMSGLASALVESTRRATRAPVSVDQRVRSLVETFFDFFEREPDAFRLLILDPWGSGDLAILAQAMAVRVSIGSELGALLSGSGASYGQTVGAAAAVVGSLVFLCEAWMGGQMTKDDAVLVGASFICAGLIGLENPSLR